MDPKSDVGAVFSGALMPSRTLASFSASISVTNICAAVGAAQHRTKAAHLGRDARHLAEVRGHLQVSFQVALRRGGARTTVTFTAGAAFRCDMPV